MSVINEKEIYNYLNEAMIIDSFKKQIENIKSRFSKSKNKSEMTELKNDAAELKDEIKSSSLNSKVKTALLAALIGIFSATGTSHAIELSDLAKEYNLKQSTINYQGNGSIIEPDESELINDAKYVAVALKHAKIQGIEVEDVQEDGTSIGGSDQTLVYNFTDGTSISVNINDVIFVYDNGILIRQYESGQPAMDALLDIAKHY
jgi:hypothetical protein